MGLALGGLWLPDNAWRGREFGCDGEGLEYGEKLAQTFENYTHVKFDENGYLLSSLNLEKDEWDSLALLPTRYNSEHSFTRNKVDSVKLFIVHFDGAVRYFHDQPRTAQNTLNGLNGRYVSVHWCVDEYGIASSSEQNSGFGILQTQNPSDERLRPYEGAHVLIGINLKTGEPDRTRLKTLDFFRKFGITSGVEELESLRTRDYDHYTVGAEQVGWKFSRDFPDLFPPPRQLGNFLSLTVAVMNEYTLSPWDVVGHHEIQEKDDPGDEFMATLRFSLAAAHLIGLASIFYFEENSAADFLDKLREYCLERMGEERFRRWSEYFEFNSFLEGLSLEPGRNR